MSKRTAAERRMTDRSGLVEGDLYGRRETIAYGTRPTVTKTAALRAVGPVVYAVRIDGMIKIGFTTNLARRVANLGSSDVLALIPGSFDDERQLHERLAPYADHGREWYPPAPEVLSVVNEMRAQIGRPPLAA